MLDLSARTVYDDCMSLLDDIRAAILKSDKTRYRIAKELGLAESQLTRLMSGERGLRMESLEMLADHLGYRITLVKKTKGKK